MIPKKATGQTPFGLVYGYDAVSPTEITVTSHRVKHFEVMTYDDQRRLKLDLVDEKRWVYKQMQ